MGRKAPTYEANVYDDLVECHGLSEELMLTHLELYQGYVTHANKALELLDSGKLDPYAEGEVRRRFVWEFNGMRLHEILFDAMTPGGTDLDVDSPLRDALEAQFGTLDDWMDGFRTTGAMRGIGWACLAYDPVGKRYVNMWINEHDAGVLAGAVPLLLMDCFEHAFIRDYGTDKERYFDAYFDNVDWEEVEERLERVLRRPTRATQPSHEAGPARSGREARHGSVR